jgi:hypothetical protein
MHNAHIRFVIPRGSISTIHGTNTTPFSDPPEDTPWDTRTPNEDEEKRRKIIRLPAPFMVYFRGKR